MKARVLILAAALAGCGFGSDPALLRLSDARSALSVPVAVDTIQLRTVSLPSYAASDDVMAQALDGTLRPVGGLAWADGPERAVTLALTRQLGRITGAIVGPDPWPLEGLADAVIDIRVQDMFAGAGGMYVLGGQYFISGDRQRISQSARQFEITIPFEGGDAAAMSQARANALLQLAERLAQDMAKGGSS